MKTKKYNLTILLILAATSLFVMQCSQVTGPDSASISLTDTDQRNEFSDPVDSGEAIDLDIAEGLQFMREEEKLARDVYLTLYQRWGQRIFKNIANSEQTHTDAIKGLLVKYAILDPVQSDNIGQFTNKNLSNLYNELVVLGEQSLLDAFRVGAAIEEIDILDLHKEIEHVTEYADITKVYENLTRGSRNHLRSFVSNINLLGKEYEPQYLEPAEYDLIISGAIETGP